MRPLQKFAASVELTSPISLRVRFQAQDEVLYYHDAISLYLMCLDVVEDDIEYCPASKLLYVKRKAAFATISGAWFPAYLSKVPISPCEEVDSSSGFFFVP
jgi:hypothetical protein